MLKLTEFENQKLAYLIGAILGDGHYTRPDEWGKIRFHFGSSDKEFVLEVKEIIKDIFSLDTNVGVQKLSLKNKAWRDHYTITSRLLYRNIVDYFPNKNEIPSFIKNSNKSIKAKFLSGFFDAEGGICISFIKSRNALDRRLYCHNSNLTLLHKIQFYLGELDIDSFIQSGKGAYALNIWGYKNLVNFKNGIDFNINRKKYKLIEAIKSYKLIHKKYRHLKINV